MLDDMEERVEQAQATETPATRTPVPDWKSDRAELKEVSRHFWRTLVRTGVHLATMPVFMLPEEPREHFVNAGREFTRGLALLTHELADVFDKTANEGKEDVEKTSEYPGS